LWLLLLLFFLFAITEFTTFFNQHSNSRKRRVAWEHLILIICGGNSYSGFYFLVADIVAIYHSLDGSTETGKINVGGWKNRGVSKEKCKGSWGNKLS